MVQTKDSHVHIGQFYDAFYDYHDVFAALQNNGIAESTCAYLTPLHDSTKDAAEFYNAVVPELQAAQEFARSIGHTVHFLHWADPLLLADPEYPLERICTEFGYEGIVIHPFLNDWGSEHLQRLTEVFEFAQKNGLPLYFHTGVSERDNPLQFEPWFAQFQDVPVRLAHCKDPEPIIQLFKKHPALTGDTAFCPQDSYRAICGAGFADRMFFGTDFPITHYWEHKKDSDWHNNAELLTQHYAQVLAEKSC